jgi:hypothetical protein
MSGAVRLVFIQISAKDAEGISPYGLILRRGALGTQKIWVMTSLTAPPSARFRTRNRNWLYVRR